MENDFSAPANFSASRFCALDYGHGHHVLGDFGINIEDAQHLFHRFLVSRMRGVALLPEKLRGAKKHARPQFPADHVRPLVIKQRQVPIALNPLREEMPDDGFRRRTNHVRLFQFLAPGDGHHGQFGGKPLHVLRFFFKKALRDQQRQDRYSDGRWL